MPGGCDVNRADALTVLERWQERMQEIEAQMDALGALLQHAPEAPLPNAVGALMSAYTHNVSRLIGCSDEWLTAWWLEHSFGERPMRAGLTGEPLRTITTLTELVRLIVNDAGAPA